MKSTDLFCKRKIKQILASMIEINGFCHQDSIYRTFYGSAFTYKIQKTYHSK